MVYAEGAKNVIIFPKAFEESNCRRTTFGKAVKRDCCSVALNSRATRTGRVGKINEGLYDESVGLNSRATRTGRVEKTNGGI